MCFSGHAAPSTSAGASCTRQLRTRDSARSSFGARRATFGSAPPFGAASQSGARSTAEQPGGARACRPLGRDPDGPGLSRGEGAAGLPCDDHMSRRTQNRSVWSVLSPGMGPSRRKRTRATAVAGCCHGSAGSGYRPAQGSRQIGRYTSRNAQRPDSKPRVGTLHFGALSGVSWATAPGLTVPGESPPPAGQIGVSRLPGRGRPRRGGRGPQ
jgi:hypothetical protein